VSETFDVLWTPSAVSDLDEILDYLDEEAGIDRALEVYARVRGQVSSLSRLPRRCRYVPELKALGLTEFREAIVPPHRIFFRLVEQRVILLGVLDGRRDLEEILIQRALEPESPKMP
jgi:plasmid stabilization system protein ParE